MFPAKYSVYRSAVYRTIELSDGWAGRIIKTQRLFSEHPPLLSMLVGL